MQYDAIIIGAGYGGLSLGAILAHQGKNVLILERAGHLGGRASYQEKDGFILEYGLHANRFGRDGAASRVFKKLGESIAFKEIGATLYYDQEKFVSIYKSLPASSIGSAMRVFPKLLTRKEENFWQVPVSEFIEQNVKNKDLQDGIVVLCASGITAYDPKVASLGEFMFYLKRVIIARDKVSYPENGTKQIISRLAQKIKTNGEIRTGANVGEIIIEANIAKGVRVDGQNFEGKTIAYAAPLQNLFNIIKEELFPSDFAHYVKNMEPVCGINLDFALKKKISDQNNLVLTINPFTEGYFTSNVDPSIAPEGLTLGQWFMPLPSELIHEKEKVDKETETMRGLLDKMYPGIWNNLEWERVLVIPMVDGFIPKPGQTQADRPDFVAPGIQNLFFAGDTTKAIGTGGDTALHSGVECSKMITAYLEQFA